jgi:hypothetical protein
MTGKEAKGRIAWETPCVTCHKRPYTSKKDAKRLARILYPGQHMQVYQCYGDDTLWHIGHIVPQVLQGRISRRDLQPRRLS